MTSSNCFAVDNPYVRCRSVFISPVVCAKKVRSPITCEDLDFSAMKETTAQLSTKGACNCLLKRRNQVFTDSTVIACKETYENR